MSASNSPCAACKFLRRKCTQECVFAPYFPSDDPKKFANVHGVFGAKNVAKLLNELNVTQRAEAVRSMAYEAESRINDPIFGCVGTIAKLQQQLKLIQREIFIVKQEIANYVGPQAMLPVMQPNNAFVPQQNFVSPSSSRLMNMMPLMGPPPTVPPSHGKPLVIREPQQQMFQAQQFADVISAREQEMRRAYEHQQQQLQLQRQLEIQQQHQHHQHQIHELMMFNNSGLESGLTGLNQMSDSNTSPSLALGEFDNGAYQEQHQQQLQTQVFLEPQQQENQHEHQLQTQALFQPQQQEHHHQHLQTQLFFQPQAEQTQQQENHHHQLQTQVFFQPQQQQTQQQDHHNRQLQTQVFLEAQQETETPNTEENRSTSNKEC